jgi:hypothetical protein
LSRSFAGGTREFVEDRPDNVSVDHLAVHFAAVTSNTQIHHAPVVTRTLLGMQVPPARERPALSCSFPDAKVQQLFQLSVTHWSPNCGKRLPRKTTCLAGIPLPVAGVFHYPSLPERSSQNFFPTPISGWAAVLFRACCLHHLHGVVYYGSAVPCQRSLRFDTVGWGKFRSKTLNCSL